MTGEFPPGKSGGLIEASVPIEIETVSVAEFPPGKSGGLIEASSSPPCRSRARSSFRRVNPAASLKPPCAQARPAGR